MVTASSSPPASYFTLLTAQPAYLHNLISVQSHGCTRSSSLITIARPLSFFSLKIIDHSFRYASPSLWNNLPASFRQPRSSSVTIITPSITSSLFHSRLKTHLLGCSTIPSHHVTIDPLLPTGLPSGLQPDCLHELRTTQRYFLVLSLSSFS